MAVSVCYCRKPFNSQRVVRAIKNFGAKQHGFSAARRPNPTRRDPGGCRAARSGSAGETRGAAHRCRPAQGGEPRAGIADLSICSAYACQSVARRSTPFGRNLSASDFDEARIDQAALVMAFLVPGIGKEDEDVVEGLVGQCSRPGPPPRRGRRRADWRVSPSRRCNSSRPTPGSMHLDAQVIDLGIGLRQRADDFAGAEPDLEAARRRPPEGRRQDPAPGPRPPRRTPASRSESARSCAAVTRPARNTKLRMGRRACMGAKCA